MTTISTILKGNWYPDIRDIQYLNFYNSNDKPTINKFNIYDNIKKILLEKQLDPKIYESLIKKFAEVLDI